ncbi:sigma-54 interaction domain-containing protein [Desulfitobacterium chlororespirans]|uniref:Transcriptional regulator containing PAS, AAA-type ATPase, and DNA-binding Fis domains n=1 Tax=Desulfitobacterium chlororespirans DSM 11544 TaxID=1121395 RepID=A0A1M7UZ22_9FIRM|nr:sigma 54-interacting transcriptional regulator [Desulfitobacterium chlororespirans]SHN88291.1 Transcriptional regulator containing PAS, AAA-type ATPase, and DNA-binding Fis domains [Desulfitobacterium chlororespirans DSM 11544]
MLYEAYDPTQYDHESLTHLRALFLSGESINESRLRTEILASWINSRMAGINPGSKLLPAPLPKEVVGRIVHSEAWIYSKKINFDYIEKYYEVFDKKKSVVLGLDLDLTVGVLGGNKSLIEKLASMNLTLGSNFNENVIGTNAAALAKKTKQGIWVIGAEHFIEALKDYACYAVPLTSGINHNITSFTMYIAPIQSFDPIIQNLVDFFVYTFNSALLINQQQTELSLTDRMVEYGLEYKDRGIILIDHRGIILKVNAWILKSCGIKSASVVGKHLTEIFPDLKEAINFLKAGKDVQFYELCTMRKLKKRNYFMDCQIVKTDNEKIGMIITISEGSHIHDLINRVAKNSAYFTFEHLLGVSKNFMEVKALAEDAAESNSNVLITGESGTGKELFAQAIHNAGRRSSKPFISINCAAIPKELIGSELFGYVTGAFTGARKEGSPGKFELADHGTIFLDEIGEMPLDMQSVLLRVLEERKVTRIGGSSPIAVDVRVIAATNQNLWQLVASGKFRHDLYFRINVLRLELPPLRDRKEDIPLLAGHFLEKFNESLGKNVEEITPEVINLFLNYNWPGNTRELRNIIERGVNLSKTTKLTLKDIPKEINVTQEQTISLNDFEKQIIHDLLTKYKGNKSRVAKELGISRATLYKKL